ncbi:putative membrane protein YjcL [Drosera capensis]
MHTETPSRAPPSKPSSPSSMASPPFAAAVPAFPSHLPLLRPLRPYHSRLHGHTPQSWHTIPIFSSHSAICSRNHRGFHRNVSLSCRSRVMARFGGNGSLIAGEDHWGLWASLLGIGAFGIWSEKTKIGSMVSPALVSILIGLAAIAIMIGTLVAFFLVLMQSLGQDSWKIAAALMGSYIGGVNFIAISEALETSSSVVAAGVAADNVICAVYFMVFFAVIGASGSILNVFNTVPSIFLFAFVQVTVHLAVVLGLGKLFQFDMKLLLLASNANVGGPTTACGMAKTNGWDSLIVPGILAGIFGISIATFLGIGFGLVVLRHM